MIYKIIVDKQPLTNPSTEKKEYQIDIEELRYKGDIYDSLVITIDEDYVMRRLELSEYGVLSVLENPIKQPLNDINIELFEGDNYIYLYDLVGNKIVAEYLVKNEFNELYVTKSEMHSNINQTANAIELSVYKQIERVDGDIEETNSRITQTAEEITTEVSKKVGEDEIISKINQSAEQVQIQADKISLDGKEIDLTAENIKIESNGFNVDENGIVKIIDNENSESIFTFYIQNQDGTRKTGIKPWRLGTQNSSRNIFAQMGALLFAYISLYDENNNTQVTHIAGNSSASSQWISTNKRVDIDTSSGMFFRNGTENNGIIFNVKGEKTLYENSSGTTGTISLSYSASNFDYIEIFYGKSEIGVSSVKVQNPNGKTVCLSQSQYASSTIFQTVSKRGIISGTSITFDKKGFGNMQHGSASEVSSEDQIKVYKVIGYAS